jgi:3'(2'), 5'-bisphosphate nucleotidase
LKNLLLSAIHAAYQGGLEILDVYNSDFAVETKDDKSPLTLADKRAHLKIVDGLKATGLHVLSEEGRSIPYEERKAWKRFWMVDPLDGTKEFVKRNGEFTVNIALIEEGVPVGGVIYVPVKEDLYFGWLGGGAYKISAFKQVDGADIDALVASAKRLPQIDPMRNFTAVGSRSHMSAETEAFFEELKKEHGEIEVVSMGSSLKICLVAEGVADVYPRFAPTMEWDTAAGHAIAKAAGKEIIDRSTGKPMLYNKENLLNNWFIVN